MFNLTIEPTRIKVRFQYKSTKKMRFILDGCIRQYQYLSPTLEFYAPWTQHVCFKHGRGSELLFFLQQPTLLGHVEPPAHPQRSPGRGTGVPYLFPWSQPTCSLGTCLGLVLITGFSSRPGINSMDLGPSISDPNHSYSTSHHRREAIEQNVSFFLK